MTPERIIKSIEGWIESNNQEIEYRKHQIENRIKDISKLQTDIDSYEIRNKENREAIKKLTEETK